MDKFVIKTPRKESIATAPNNDKPLKRKSQAEKDKQYKKKRKREFQQTWLIDFPWLRYKETLDDKISFCILCRKYPQLVDQRSDSNLFVGKVVDRRNTLLQSTNHS